MKLSADFISFFISCAFALLGFFNYLMADEPFIPLWIVSFFALLVTIGIDVIDRLEVKWE